MLLFDLPIVSIFFRHWFDSFQGKVYVDEGKCFKFSFSGRITYLSHTEKDGNMKFLYAFYLAHVKADSRTPQGNIIIESGNTNTRGYRIQRTIFSLHCQVPHSSYGSFVIFSTCSNNGMFGLVSFDVNLSLILFLGLSNNSSKF